MKFRSGDFVSYLGRAGRVCGVESVGAAGASLDVLAIELTASPGAMVRVPMKRAQKHVQRISAAQANALDANPIIPVFRALTKMQRAHKEEARRERLAEFGRQGGLTKAKKRVV